MFRRCILCVGFSILLFIILFSVPSVQAQDTPNAVAFTAPRLTANTIAAAVPLSVTAQYTAYLPVVLSNYQKLPELDITDYDLEEEYVEIQNRDIVAITMTNFTLSDNVYTYTFPADFALSSGATVRVWTREGTDDAANLYWNRSSSVWNDSGDTAYLRNAQGTLIHFLELFPRDTRLYDLQIIFSHNPTTGELLHELIDIYNQDNAAVNIGGYQLSTAAGITFTFPTNFTLPKNGSVRVWTGAGTNDTLNVYAARTTELWNNAGDTAYLHNIRGAVVVSQEVAAQDYAIAALRVISSANPADDTGTPAVREDIDEFIELVNPESDSVDMSGYTLSDEASNTYTFPDGFTLAAGATVRIWTKAGTDDAANLYWGKTVPVWDNRGDAALLKDASGNLVHTYPTIVNWENS